MDGHGEAIAVWHMRFLGFSDAVPSGCWKAKEYPTTWAQVKHAAVMYVNHPDKGIDIVSTKAVAQVKTVWSKATPQEQIQNIEGAAALKHRRKRKLFYAVSYTKDALDWARSMKTPLFALTKSGDVVAVNNDAHELVAAVYA